MATTRSLIRADQHEFSASEGLAAALAVPTWAHSSRTRKPTRRQRRASSARTRLLSFLLSLALVGTSMVLAGCGGGEEPLEGNSQPQAMSSTSVNADRSTTIPVDCGGGVTCK